jgi:hypothetical protein
MNKLKLLYEVTRTMKNLEKIEGVLQMKVRRDQDEVFSLHNQFEKNQAGKSKTTVSTVLNLGGAQVTRESTTEFDLSGRCSHGHGMLHRMFHAHHDAHHGGRAEGRCCGIKGAFSRLSLAFGILSSIEVEEKDNGAAQITLDLNDAPEELKAALQEKLQHKHDCLSQHGFLREGHQVESLTGALVVRVNKERAIENISVELGGTERDEDQTTHSMAALAEVEFA